MFVKEKTQIEKKKKNVNTPFTKQLINNFLGQFFKESLNNFLGEGQKWNVHKKNCCCNDLSQVAVLNQEAS